MRRNVAVGGLIGGFTALLLSASSAYKLLPPEPIALIAAAALLALGSAVLWLIYSKEGRGKALEAVAAQLLAFLSLAPPIYTFLLRITQQP